MDKRSDFDSFSLNNNPGEDKKEITSHVSESPIRTDSRKVSLSGILDKYQSQIKSIEKIDFYDKNDQIRKVYLIQLINENKLIYKFIEFPNDCEHNGLCDPSVCKTKKDIEFKKQLIDNEFNIGKTFGYITEYAAKYLDMRSIISKTATTVRYEMLIEWGGYDLKKVEINDKNVFTIIYQLACALSIMEFYGIFHSDIKITNIVWNQENNKLKLIDFGNSMQFLHDPLEITNEQERKTLTGFTNGFAPPEVYDKEFKRIIPGKIDAFAFGITLALILLMERKITDVPFFKYDTNEKVTKFLDFLNKTLNVTPFLKIISECLNPEPKKRPTFEKIRQNIEEILVNIKRTDIIESNKKSLEIIDMSLSKEEESLLKNSKFCINHPEVIAEYFCEECFKVCCKECAQLHIMKKHKTYSVAEKSAQILKELDIYRRKALEKMNELYLYHEDKFNSDMEEENELINRIEIQMACLLEEMRKNRSNRAGIHALEKQYMNKIEHFAREVKELNDNKKYLDTCVYYNNLKRTEAALVSHIEQNKMQKTLTSISNMFSNIQKNITLGYSKLDKHPLLKPDSLCITQVSENEIVEKLSNPDVFNKSIVCVEGWTTATDKVAGKYAEVIEKSHKFKIGVLFGKKIKNTGVQTIAKSISQSKTIKGLYFSAGKIYDESALELSKAIQMCPSMTKLFFGSKMTDKSIKEFLLNIKNLKELSLSSSHLTDTGAKIIADSLGQFNDLQALFIRSDIISDIGSKAISKAVGLSRTICRYTSAAGKQTDEGAKEFCSALESNNIVKEVFCRGDSITNNGAKALASTFAKLERINAFAVTLGKMNDDGVKYFANAVKGSQHIKKFFVISPKTVGDDSAIHISEAALLHKNIEAFGIIANELTKFGLMQMGYAAKEVLSIKRVLIGSAKIDSEDIKKFLDLLLFKGKDMIITINTPSLDKKQIKDLLNYYGTKFGSLIISVNFDEALSIYRATEIFQFD